MSGKQQTISPRPAARPTQANVRHADDDAPGTLSKLYVNDVCHGTAQRLVRRLCSPRNAREFWGKILDGNPKLRQYRDDQVVQIARGDFRDILQRAFNEGKAAGK